MRKWIWASSKIEYVCINDMSKFSIHGENEKRFVIASGNGITATMFNGTLEECQKYITSITEGGENNGITN